MSKLRHGERADRLQRSYASMKLDILSQVMADGMPAAPAISRAAIFSWPSGAQLQWRVLNERVG